MTKRFLTYHAREHDPKETQVADLKFTDGVEVEVPEGRTWLWWRLQSNPWFTARVEEDNGPGALGAEETPTGPLVFDEKAVAQGFAQTMKPTDKLN